MRNLPEIRIKAYMRSSRVFRQHCYKLSQLNPDFSVELFVLLPKLD